MKILRLLKITFLVIVALALVLLFFANNQPVTLNLLPDAMAEALGIRNAFTTSLFLVVVAALLVGIVVGFFWEWLREHRHRAEARTQRREATRLSQEVAAMKGRRTESQDEILALLDNPNGAR